MKKRFPPFFAFTLSVLMLLSFGVEAQFFYGLRQDFGKNRVQFNDVDWVLYRFEAYDVYFTRGNENLAEQVARMTHAELPKIENYLDAPLDDRLQILVFSNLTDLKESNVNGSDEEDFSTGGITRISGRRLFVYFDGDYTNMRRTLRMGLTEVVLSNMVYGSFTQSITNSALLNLPLWYTEGLISYMGEAWYPEVDVQVREGFFSGRYDKINALMQQDARYAGHSFWHFIAKTYGDKIIRNIVYMSVVNRDIESGFLYVLGKDMESITREWKAFYKQRNGEDAQTEISQDNLFKLRGKHFGRALEISQNERYLSYVQQRFSRYQVFIYDLQENKRQRILTGGYRIAQNTDRSYPLMAWHPNNQLLAIVTEEKGIVYLNFYDLEKKQLERKPFYRFDKIVDLKYSPNGKQFLFSAVKEGQSDIFVYTILNTKIKAITNDDYDDLNPVFFDGSKRIAWSSNRPVDSLYPNRSLKRIPSQGLDLFATENRDLGEDSLKIWRMTSSPAVNETDLQFYQPGYLSFFSDRQGKRTQHLVKIDSAIAYVDTITHYDYFFEEYRLEDYNWSLVDQVYAPNSDKRFDLVFFDKRYRVLEKPFLSPDELGLEPLTVRSSALEEAIERAPRSTRSESQASSGKKQPLYYPGITREELPVNILNYRFDENDQVPAPTKDKQLLETPNVRSVPLLPQSLNPVTAREDDELEVPPVRNYFSSFYQDDFSVNFDNMFDNPQYQPFTGVVNGDLLNQGFNMNFKVGVMDLMHDYRIIAGSRFTFQPLPGTSLLPNAEFMIGLSDLKDRYDKFYTYTRRSQVQFLSQTNYRRIIVNELNARLSYPFSPVARLEGSLGYRIDENIRLARDFNALDEEIDYTDYAIARAAYVYDNTRNIGLNLYAGLRYRVFTEYYRNLTISESGLHTAGFDFRHYLVLHRNMIWANRLAAGTSFGPEKLIHIMGGVDNAFGPRTDPSTPIARENNYVFQTLVTNMRGFIQNVRNGNSFAVLNSELRWPIVSYFANRPIRNDFFNNLMLIGFTDVGTAWNGPSPWDPENAINTRTIPLGTGGQIVLDSQKDPIVLGYGAGLRSRLFGYYVRADWAWGVEDGIVLPRVFYLSLNMDF